MTNRKPSRYVEHWETVAVTALPPGWRNVYRHDDGPSTSPCPAILLQEHRSTVACWDIPLPEGHYDVRTEEKLMQPPYETRAVFADYDMATLCPADDVGNYERTIGPEETP
ncbi:hypothetical protein [Nonomuraea cavernae]|uniref:Uncharacterized protein n=1 Tax=Nonomuraea cavernae TaxID=2045107 RepID=A0A917Z1V8_9ACTN|nr:hypothetical protein [Nonomuraea cavernae]MCA2187733.1 hypothetical protein [Nonomuraea cavernae]GGO70666.1 hypothetical protein GCM10012289_34600 [Nonomuraea cavernae]